MLDAFEVGCVTTSVTPGLAVLTLVLVVVRKVTCGLAPTEDEQ